MWVWLWVVVGNAAIHDTQHERQTNMQVGDKVYQGALHRWTHLASMTVRTWEQQQELESLNRALDDAERRHIERNVFELVASDYAETMQLHEAGNLGEVEL